VGWGVCARRRGSVWVMLHQDKQGRGLLRIGPTLRYEPDQPHKGESTKYKESRLERACVRVYVSMFVKKKKLETMP
jgi:hypothetical protein